MTMQNESSEWPTDWQIRLCRDHSTMSVAVPDGPGFTQIISIEPKLLCDRQGFRVAAMTKAFVYLSDADLDAFYAKLPDLLDDAKRDAGLVRWKEFGGEG